MQGTMQNKGVVYEGGIHLLSSHDLLSFSIWYKTSSFLINVLHRFVVWLILWVHFKKDLFPYVFWPLSITFGFFGFSAHLLWMSVNLVEVTSSRPPFLNKTRLSSNQITAPLAMSTVCNTRSVPRPVKAHCCKQILHQTLTHTYSTFSILWKIHAVITVLSCITVHKFK